MLSDTASPGSLTIVGAGVIGLTCALAAHDAGWRVQVIATPEESSASEVAGGMLGSLGEGHPGEHALLAISARSVRRWPDLLARLDDPTLSVAEDSLFVAATATDREYLTQLADFVWSTDDEGEPTDRLRRVDARQIRTLEPSLNSRLVGGYLAVGEGALDNRRLLARLSTTLTSAGVEIRRGRVEELAELPGDRVLVSAGLGSTAVLKNSRLKVPSLHPAKGEILRLAHNRWSVPPPRHVVRARVRDRMVYLVPRADGIVVGATQYEPFDTSDHRPQARGVAHLLADAIEVMPGLQTYDLVEAAAGLRPMTADGLPVVEAVDHRIIAAFGHGRNGIVLAPWTAERVLEILEDGGTS